MAKTIEIGPYSAYAIAVKNGFSGTEQEWLASLIGPQGPQGASVTGAKIDASQHLIITVHDPATGGDTEIDAGEIGTTEAVQAVQQAIQQAGQSAVSAVESAGSTQQNAVTSVGTQAISAIGSAQQEAVQQVQQAGAESITSAQQEAEKAASSATQASESASAAASSVSAAQQSQSAASSSATQAGESASAAKDSEDAAAASATAAAASESNAEDAADRAEQAAQNSGLPQPTTADAGKAPTVKADGSTYELAGPYAPIAAAIRPTASGNPVSITDSVEWPLQGLKVYGKSTQNGTPSPESPVPIVSAGDDGNVGVSVAGKNLFDYNSLIENKAYSQTTGGLVDNTGYMSTPKISVIPGAPYRVNGNNPNVNAAIWVQWDKEGNLLSRESSIASNYAKNLLPKTAYLAITFYTNIEPQWLEKAIVSYGLDEIVYEPYKGLQSLTIPTPNGLPGIPVDSGGNYTDASGQQWECDEIDYKNEAYIKNLTLIPDLSIGTFNKHSDGMFVCGVDVFSAPHGNSRILPRCTHLPSVIYQHGYGILISFGYIIIGTALAETFGSVDNFNNFLLEQRENNTPVQLLYCQNETTETPLSEEEIAAYRTLHTYDGATVVSTAEDVAGLDVRYVADAQKYIDNKIRSALAPVNQAILEAKTNV